MSLARIDLSVAIVLAIFCACSASSIAEEKFDRGARDIALRKASDKEVADFKADEALLLKANPIGGVHLSKTVKSLVLAAPSLVADLLLLSKKANRPQAASIGVGIGQAVKALEASDKALAEWIAAQVASEGSPELLEGYAIGVSQTLTYAGGVAGDGGKGGMSDSQPYSQHGTSSYFMNGAANSSYGGAYVTCSNSVSPYRSCK
jgi:hypothetical protein